MAVADDMTSIHKTVTEQLHWIFPQPETHPTTEEQLKAEVRAIYAGLAMVEERCIGHQQSDLPSIQDQWQLLFSLHQLLLDEHKNFFFVSQHPSASLALKQLPEKYAMPARMWRYGIHSFLELMRHQLPDSLEHLLRFFHLAYSMIALLLENVPVFESIWIECLGDLARYRMAIEDSDLANRKIWADIARYWYHKVADKNPNLDRIQHHLAVLAWPDMLQQLFHYTKSLVGVCPFPNAGESILLLFDPLLDESELYGQPVAVSTFVASHRCLFKKGPISDLQTSVQVYLSHLKKYIDEFGTKFKIYRAYIASCNFAAIFEYGSVDAKLPSKFEENFLQQQQQGEEQKSVSSNIIYYSSCLAFGAFSVILDQIGNEHVYPAVHVYLVFLWCMELNDSMGYINLVILWSKISTFLNRMICSDTQFSAVECDEFPVAEGRKNMPEDFLIHGQIWSQHYFPVDYFKDAMAEDDGRSIEVPSLRASRMYRCLWLGRKLDKVCLISFLSMESNH